MPNPGDFNTWVPNESRVLPSSYTGVTASLFERSLGQYLWNNRVYNVLDYGTPNDGSADAQPGIAAAIAAAPADGAIVRIPPGTYRLDSPIELQGQNHIWVDGGAVLQVNNDTAAFLVNDPDARGHILGPGLLVGMLESAPPYDPYLGVGVLIVAGRCLIDGLRAYQLHNFMIDVNEVPNVGQTCYNSFHHLMAAECKGGVRFWTEGPNPDSVASILTDSWFLDIDGPSIYAELANDLTIANVQGESLQDSNSDGFVFLGCGGCQLSNIYITAKEGRAFVFDSKTVVIGEVTTVSPCRYIQATNLGSVFSNQGAYFGGAQMCQVSGLTIQTTNEWGLKLGADAQAIQLSNVILFEGSQVTGSPACIVETESGCSIIGFVQYSPDDTYGLSLVNDNYLSITGITGLYGSTGAVEGGVLPRHARAVGGNLVTHNGGQAVFNGDGSTKTFAVNHNMSFTPAIIRFVVAGNQTFAPQARLYAKDGTSFTVRFQTAPPSGTGNVVIDWDAALTL